MKQFEYVEDAKLRKPTTPSTWKCFPEYTLITRVRMACGGGLGGASWYEYVYRLDEIPTNKIIEVKRYDGKTIRLNTAYMVSAEDFKLANGPSFRVDILVQTKRNITFLLMMTKNLICFRRFEDE